MPIFGEAAAPGAVKKKAGKADRTDLYRPRGVHQPKIENLRPCEGLRVSTQMGK